MRPRRGPFGKPLPYLLSLLIGAACVTAPSEQRPRTAEMTSFPIRIFPELGPLDTAYRWIGGAVPPDRHAPACGAPAPPPASWAIERVVTRSQFLEALEVAVPPGLAGARRADLDVDPDAETRGGILVASWDEPEPASGGNRPTGMHLAVWIGPEDGYPTIGLDTATVQIYARQCRTNPGGAEGYAVEFVVRTPLGTDGYLAAVRPVAPGRYLRVIVGGVDAARLPDARAMLGSIRVIPRSR